MQDLLSVEVVSTASKFPQAIREAPASITVVTDEEIRRFGYRTLADVLRSVRGFYTTYDRNYAYVGMRGFARPGDYNTRVLLLVDGHRLNDDIYDQAPIGTDFPIDLSLVERVEVIRGPASSLYGTNALFGVINVVTKTGADRKGVRADAAAGSLATGGAGASYGRLFGDGRELLVAATTYRSAGQRQLHFPEFGADGTATAWPSASIRTTCRRHSDRCRWDDGRSARRRCTVTSTCRPRRLDRSSATIARRPTTTALFSRVFTTARSARGGWAWHASRTTITATRVPTRMTTARPASPCLRTWRRRTR